MDTTKPKPTSSQPFPSISLLDAQPTTPTVKMCNDMQDVELNTAVDLSVGENVVEIEEGKPVPSALPSPSNLAQSINIEMFNGLRSCKFNGGTQKFIFFKNTTYVGVSARPRKGNPRLASRELPKNDDAEGK